ncbi:MAG: preprotein translocase subunit SecY, partial [Bacteroidetes bacterium]|nr:preprotein translocase subunit SecY [Bacteroidota bacterium]
MLKLIQTIKNIWKIEDLRVRILFTAGFIMIYRLGSYVVLPGIDPNALAEYSKQANEGLLGLINMFAGGAFSRASIFALGIMPYISASIVIQLLGIAVPYFQKLQKEGESGRKKINQITRVLTIAVTAVQSVAFLRNLNVQAGMAIISQTNPEVLSPAIFFVSSITLLTTGTMFVMWLGEKITDKGIGNGISLLIMIGIIARLPGALFSELEARLGEAGGGLIIFFLEIVALLFVILGTVLLVQGTRRIPVQYAKRIVGNRQYGGVRQYLPLKVNSAGVMPIIFAQALMFIPPTIAQFFPDSSSWSGIAGSFNNYASFGYNFTFAILIIL